MNIDKLREWVDLAQSFGEGDYWDQLFEGKGESAAKKKLGITAAEYPLVDIYQSASEITVVAELPGIRKEDLSLSVSCNILHLGCNVRPLNFAGNAVQSERYMGAYDRQIRLPAAVDGSAVSANLADGLLIIRFRKTVIVGEPISLD